MSDKKPTMKRRDFLKLLGVGAAATVLPSCAAGSETPISAPAVVTNQKAKELSILIHSSQQVDIFKALGERFTQDTGTALNIIEVPFSELKPRLMSELVAGTGVFDLAVITPAMLFAATPYLEDLTTLYTKELLSLIPKGAQDMAKGTDNVFRGMPFDLIGPANFYRTDLYEELGLQPPTNWTEWLEVCKATTIEGEGDQPKTWGTLIEASSKAIQPAVKMVSWFYQNGGSLYDENQQPTLNVDANIEALQFIADMVNVHKVAPAEAPEMTYEEVHNMFIQGRGASAVNWSYMAGLANGDDSKIKGKFGVAPWPGNVQDAVLMDSWTVTVPKDSTKKDSAMEFCPYLTTKEGQMDILRIEDAFLIPSYFDANDPEILEISPYIGAWIGQADAAVAQPKWENLDTIWSSISVAMNAAVTQAMSPKEALDLAQEEAESLV